MHVLWPEKLKEIVFKIPMKKNWKMIPILRNVVITKKCRFRENYPNNGGILVKNENNEGILINNEGIFVKQQRNSCKQRRS